LNFKSKRKKLDLDEDQLRPLNLALVICLPPLPPPKHVVVFANDLELLQFENNTKLLEKQFTSKATSQSTTKSTKTNFHEQKLAC